MSGERDATVDIQFRQKICAAATAIAEAEFFRGPVDFGRSFEEHRNNIDLKRRKEDAALNAVIDVVLFAKARGDEITAQPEPLP